jgi:uncharacterized protein
VLFAIHCLDRADSAADRKAHFEAHIAYLKALTEVRIVVSGPLLADDGATTIGSRFIIDAPGKAEVVAFNRADPFSGAAIWRETRIHPFLKRIDNRN